METKIIKSILSKIETPKKVVYNVDYEDGPVVTFYHNDHTDLFNIKCESCHQNETCARCHDAQKKTADVEKEPHENCIACHEDAIEENCEKGNSQHIPDNS